MNRRHTTRSRRAMHQLSEELTIGAALRLRVNADDIRHIVTAVVAYMIEEYPSQTLYIPSGVNWPLESIRADFEHMSMRKLCRKYRTDRRTLYRLLDMDPG